jgi:DNA-binding NarL/FixJ family response regulator
MRLRIGLADDNLLIREALSSLIRDAPGLELVAVCDDADELSVAVDEQGLDVVITDIRMPPTMTDDGIQLAVRLRATHPSVGVIVVSAYCEPAYALDLLRTGSDRRAYLLKDRILGRDDLRRTVEEVARGGSVIDPKVVEALVQNETPGRAPASLATLSGREREILAEMARGVSNPGIADALGLTKRAVEKHVNAIFAKLELPPTPDVSRRVRAVLLYLVDAPAGGPTRPAVGLAVEQAELTAARHRG